MKLIKPTRLFVQDQLIPTFVPMAENIGMENIYVLGDNIEGLRSFEEIIEDARSRAMTLVSPRPVTRDTLAYLIFSSGTTGPPKGRWIAPYLFHRRSPYHQAVMISHGNIICNINMSRVFRSHNAKSVSLHFSIKSIKWCAQFLLQNGSTQRPRLSVYLARASMCFVSGLRSCCFHSFISPATCVIISDSSVEATLEAFVSQWLGHTKLLYLF